MRAAFTAWFTICWENKIAFVGEKSNGNIALNDILTHHFVLPHFVDDSQRLMASSTKTSLWKGRKSLRHFRCKILLRVLEAVLKMSLSRSTLHQQHFTFSFLNVLSRTFLIRGEVNENVLGKVYQLIVGERETFHNLRDCFICSKNAWAECLQMTRAFVSRHCWAFESGMNPHHSQWSPCDFAIQ